MNRFLFMLMNPDEPAPRSHLRNRNVDPGKGTEWRTNVTMATKRAAKKLGCWVPLRMVERLADREPLRDSDYVYAVYLFLEEMDGLNKEGCPDDYEGSWGEQEKAAHWVRVRSARMAQSVRRTVAAQGMTA